MSDWVPQRELLNHPKTRLFLTHCGANGVIEAMYYGVAMLGFPQLDEQFHVAYRLKHLGIADTVPKGSNAEFIYDKVMQLIDVNSQPQILTRAQMKLYEFEEVRGQQGVDYWISYFAKHGQRHHFNPIHFQSQIVKADFDIIGVQVVTVYLFYCLLKKLIF
jgi:glucuronosyltransferase